MHPPINHDEDDEVIDYPYIASLFPDMPLGIVLNAEKEFLRADTDGSGEIDISGKSFMLLSLSDTGPN